MYRIFESGFGELLKELSKPFLMGAVQVLVFLLVPQLPFNVFYSLLIKGVIFTLTFLLGLVITGQMKEMLQVIRKK